MPVVEKTHGGRVVVRDIGEFEAGDRGDVSDAAAAYLCDERGDFARVDDDDETDESYPTESDDDADGGVTGDDAESDDTCDVVKTDGEVCGRDLPCPYHSDDDDDLEEA